MSFLNRENNFPKIFKDWLLKYDTQKKKYEKKIPPQSLIFNLSLYEFKYRL